MKADSKEPPRSPRKGTKAPAAASARPKRIEPPHFPMSRKFGLHSTTIQPLQPSDRDTLLKFFGSHTRETIHLRYGYEISQITEARAAELVGVDQAKDAALGVFETDQAVPLVAIGRYCLQEDGTSAEVAFVVKEDRRHLGIATALLHILIRLAASRGLRTLEAQVLRENLPMLEIFARLGARKSGITGTDSVGVTIDVAEAHRRLAK